jgi:hypothetical protein
MIIHKHPLRGVLAIALALTCLSAGGADARQKHPAGEAALLSHHHYVNVDGHVVHSPSRTVSGHAPAGASAHCSGGSYSFSQHRRGTCSHHGGVGAWL